MKRTALRNASKKLRQLAYERAMYRWYGENNGIDEIAWWLGGYCQNGHFCVQQRFHYDKALQRHHIVRVGRRRHLRSILIVLNEETHHWAQSIEPNKGLVACVLAKLRKQQYLGEPAEFSIEEANFANGGKSVAAEIEAFDFEEERWQCWQRECLKRLTWRLTNGQAGDGIIGD